MAKCFTRALLLDDFTFGRLVHVWGCVYRVLQLKTGTLVQSKSVFFNAITDLKVDFANTTILIAAQNGDICLFNLVE